MLFISTYYLNKNESVFVEPVFSKQMDPPKTRRESKKDQCEKAVGKNGKYNAKHVRLTEKRKT